MSGWAPTRGRLASYRGSLYYFQPNGSSCYLYEFAEDFGERQRAAFTLAPWNLEEPTHEQLEKFKEQQKVPSPTRYPLQTVETALHPDERKPDEERAKGEKEEKEERENAEEDTRQKEESEGKDTEVEKMAEETEHERG